MLICTKMKNQIIEEIEIPSGINCEYKDGFFICKKDSMESKKKIAIPNISLDLKDNKIILSSIKANKKDRKKIISYISHVKNIFEGFDKKYIYHLESCNVHFPMTLKIEGNKLAISNFLGEKTPRYANILPNVDVQIKGSMITITSYDKEAAGQTAANFEKATKVKNRDRRIFQDGIFLTKKPGDKK